MFLRFGVEGAGDGSSRRFKIGALKTGEELSDFVARARGLTIGALIAGEVISVMCDDECLVSKRIFVT